MSLNILPDSRPRRARGVIRSPIGNLRPVFCFMCGKPWGMVPEKHCRFICVLCDDECVPKYGHLVHFYAEPDHVFWARVREEVNLEAVKAPERAVADVLRESLENPRSQLALLAKDWDRKLHATSFADWREVA